MQAEVETRGVSLKLQQQNLTLADSLQAELDPLMECLSRLSGLVPVSSRPADHPSLLVIEPDALDDSVPDGLGHDVLGVLLVIELKLDADVLKRNLGVGERDLVDAGLDDVVTETEDEGEGGVGLEGGGVNGEGSLKGRKVANSDGCRMRRDE